MTTAEKAIELLRQTRKSLAATMDALSLEQMLAIPSGFRNNILWNVGHVVVAQQGLHYRLAGLELYVDDDLVQAFRRGSDPAAWETPPDAGRVRELLTELPDRLMEDYRAGRFSGYQEYTTAAGLTLSSIDEAILFNNYHEGYHAGIVRLQRRLVEAA